jgi:hypothetical protein
MTDKKVKKKYRHGIEKNEGHKIKKGDLLKRIEVLEHSISKLINGENSNFVNEVKNEK